MRVFYIRKSELSENPDCTVEAATNPARTFLAELVGAASPLEADRVGHEETVAAGNHHDVAGDILCRGRKAEPPRGELMRHVPHERVDLSAERLLRQPPLGWADVALGDESSGESNPARLVEEVRRTPAPDQKETVCPTGAQSQKNGHFTPHCGVIFRTHI